MKKLLVATTSSLFALSLSAGMAQAGTADCALSDVTANLISGTVDATACVGELEIGDTEWDYNNDVLGDGNPLLSELNNLFDVNYDWTFVNKDENSGSNAGFDAFSTTKSGTWSVDSALDGPFAISLKAGTGFSVYLFDNLTQAVSSGTWSTLGIENDGGKQPNLSHISLFKTTTSTCTDCEPNPVPEPGLAIGLGAMALGAIKARKRG